MFWVSVKNIYHVKAYVDWLAVSEWLCSFFKLWEGKNDCICPYISAFEAKFQAIFANIHPEMSYKAWKAAKDTSWVAWNSICHRFVFPYDLYNFV